MSKQKFSKSEKSFSPGRQLRLAFGMRIREVRKALRLSQLDLTRLIGRASNNAVSRLEIGTAEMVPFDVLDVLIGLAAKVGHSPEWLVSGRENAETPEILKALQGQVEDLSRRMDAIKAEPADPAFAVVRVVEGGYELREPDVIHGADWARHWVPVLGRIAAGRAGVGVIEANQFGPGQADALVRFEGAPEGAFALKVQGDSMAPRFDHRDLVVCDPHSPVESGLACCVYGDTSGEAVAKLKTIRRTGETFVLSSLNANYKAVEIAAKDMYLACRVVAHLPWKKELKTPRR